MTNKKYREETTVGYVPKVLDDHDRVQMMGFIAYAQNLEQTVKLLTFCKNVNFNEAHDKNRIFVTGTAMMSTKLSTSAAAIQKATDALQNPNNHNSSIHVGKIRRTCILDRA